MERCHSSVTPSAIAEEEARLELRRREAEEAELEQLRAREAQKVRVYSLGGLVLLTLPWSEAADLRVAGLTRRLRQPIATHLSAGISDSRVILMRDQRVLKDDDIVGMIWPPERSVLELQLTIRSTREDQLEQEVLCLLRQPSAVGSVDTADSIVAGVASIELQSPKELSVVLRTLFSEAAIRGHLSETCADASLALRRRYPDFLAEEDGNHVSFTRAMVKSFQEIWESRLLASDVEGVPLRADRGAKTMAIIELLSCLFLRDMVPLKVLGHIVHDMIGVGRNLEVFAVEAACQLLRAVGDALERQHLGKMLWERFAARLHDLDTSTASDGSPLLSEAVRSKIQELLVWRQQDPGTAPTTSVLPSRVHPEDGHHVGIIVD